MKLIAWMHVDDIKNFLKPAAIYNGHSVLNVQPSDKFGAKDNYVPLWIGSADLEKVKHDKGVGEGASDC